MAKLTKKQLKSIVDEAKKIRRAGGTHTKQVKVYNRKWATCMKEASKNLGFSKKK